MRIRTLDLQNFRNYTEASLEPDPNLNILLGKNAQGKTSLLEGIYILSTTRSWRAGRDTELIHWDADYAHVSAEVSREYRNDVEISITLSRSEKKTVKVNTIRQTKLANVMGELNTVLIEPHDVDIVRGEPSHRRRFLNLEISQVQPQYCHLLVNYKRVLEQRNRLLKELQSRQVSDGVLDVLNEQLVTYGSRILERRLEFVSHLDHLANIIHGQITSGQEDLKIKYASNLELVGSESAESIQAVFRHYLRQIRADEIRRGVTLAGPHRDDLTLTVNGIDARIYGSQGQQRTIALSLRLAEVEIMEETAKEPPVVLLDDVMTDLDEERRTHVFQMTRGRCQTFMTAASMRALDAEFLSSGKVYRIDDGQVRME